RNRQYVGAVIGAGGLHVEHARDAVDLQLNGQSDRVDNGLRAGAGIARRHLDGRRYNVRILRHWQAEQAEGADQHQHDRQYIGEDRMLDEKFRHHGLAPAELASIEVSCGVTLVPGVARQSSPTTTRSSGFRPEVMTRKVPSSWPSCT